MTEFIPFEPFGKSSGDINFCSYCLNIVVHLAKTKMKSESAAILIFDLLRLN